MNALLLTLSLCQFDFSGRLADKTHLPPAPEARPVPRPEVTPARADSPSYQRPCGCARGTRPASCDCLKAGVKCHCPQGTQSTWRVSKVIPTAQEAPAWQLGRLIADYPSPSIVFLTAPWCAACRVAKANVVPTLKSSGWSVVEVNADSGNWRKTFGNVPQIPTFIVIRNKMEVARYTGSNLDEMRHVLVEAVKD